MKALKEFNINFGNLKIGVHEYDFDINDVFFKEFEYSLIQFAEVKAKVKLDKKKETMLSLTISLEGQINVECDRCLDEFPLPFKNEHHIYVKLSDKDLTDGVEDEELIILSQDANELDLATILYELITIEIPIKKVCADVGKECNPEMLARISNYDPETKEIKDELPKSEEDSTEDGTNPKIEEEPLDPRFAALKQIHKKN